MTGYERGKGQISRGGPLNRMQLLVVRAMCNGCRMRNDGCSGVGGSSFHTELLNGPRVEITGEVADFRGSSNRACQEIPVLYGEA